MPVVNPYSHVNWEDVDHVRAQLHVHEPRNPIDPTSDEHEPTTEDGLEDPHRVDDDAASPGTLVEKYRNAGYRVLALTEHEHVTPDSEHESVTPGTSWPWSRWDVDPASLGMVALQGAELRGSLPAADELHDVVSLDNDLEHGDGAPLETVLAEIGARDGMAFLAHPGKYFEPDEWTAYVPAFEAASELLGVEITNGPDRYPSRGIWDGLLGHFGGDRPVWGFGNDDYHARPRPATRFDRSRTVLLPESLTTAGVRSALREGRSYVQYDGRVDDSGEAPAITRISESDDVLVLESPDAREIAWISAGAVIETGNALPVERVREHGYVRAEVYGEGDAVTYTQPFFSGSR